MIDPGTSVTLVVQTYVVDPVTGARTLTDAGATPTLAITKPDQSVMAGTVGTRLSTGTYACTVVDTTQAGLYRAVWTSASGLILVFDDSFLVSPAGSQLIGIADAIRAVSTDGTSLTDADKDDLRELVAAARPVIEDIVGPCIPVAFDEYHDGGSMEIITYRSPLISLTLVEESYGAYNRTLTAQPLNGNAFDGYGYTVDLEAGAVQRRVSGQAGRFPNGRNNIHLTGVAGRIAMPPAVARMTRRYVKWQWQTERNGNRQANARPDQVTTTPSGFLVPVAVISMAGDLVRAPAML